MVMPLPFLAPAVGFLAKPLIKWGLIALVIGGLFFGLIWFKHEAKVAREAQALAETRAGMWEGQATAAIGELKNVRTQLDALDASAKAQQRIADQRVADLSAQRDAALSRAETFRTELMRKANEPGATAASVGRAALEGLR
jgi:HAMP domain-containing protein